MASNEPNRHELDVAILGGGFAGAYCAKTLTRRLGRSTSIRVGLISQNNYMVFQPMLPEVAGGSISPFHVVNPLRLLCRRAQIFNGQVESIDWPHRKLTLNAGAFSGDVAIHFRHLVLALGASIDLSRIPGMSEHALLMQNVGDAMRLRRTLISRMEEANLEMRPELKRRLLTVVVVGGGYSGVETAGHILDLFRSIHSFYSAIDYEDIRVFLIHSRDHLLSTLSENLGRYSERKLGDRGLKVILNQRVKAVTAKRVYLQDDSTIDCDTVISTIGNAPHPLVRQLCEDNDLATEDGRVVTSSKCRVQGQTELWAAGDCASIPYVKGGTCPATAQFAFRQGILAGENLHRHLNGKPLQPFTFKEQGELASLGHHTAVADIFGFKFSGFLAWWLWRTIYLLKLPRFDRKFRVVIDWTLDLFFPRDINLLNPRYSTLLGELYLEPGDYLYHESDPAFSFYIVKQGAIELLDQQGVIDTIHEGEYFGERALLEKDSRAFDARAASASTLIALPAGIFHQIVRGAGSLARLLKKSAAKHQSREVLQTLLNKMPAAARTQYARDLMKTSIFTLTLDMTCAEIIRVLKTQPHGSYPVVDSQSIIQGLLNRDDFYDILKSRPEALDIPVRKLPLASPVTVTEDLPGEEVMRRLIRSGKHKALVADQNGKLKGVITVVDLMPATDLPSE